jgi:subtilase family serine protease
MITPDASGNGGGPYTPQQIRHAYGIDTIANMGSGQIIAIVDAYGSPTIQSDLALFSQNYGLPYTTGSNPTLKIVNATTPPTTTDSGWALETSLDVEWAHVIAPKAQILLVVAKTANWSDLFAAIDKANSYVSPTGRRVNQVSMSWGGSEWSGETYYDYHFSTAGVSYFASSGDSGAGVIWPAASTKVTAVGGTSLSLDAQGNVLGETAWSGSGGGVSAFEALPAYQQPWISAGKRQVPDVAYNADPNTGMIVYCSPYAYEVGGTSAGAPQWAAIMALVNEKRAHPLGQANPALYSIGTPALEKTYFRDIVSGSDGALPADQAHTGFDDVTGLGSPLANKLVPALVAH